MDRHGASRCHRMVEQTADILEIAAQSPAVQSLARRLENGVVLSCAGVDAGAQPFLAAALRRPDQRGKWGEMSLKRVIELAGLVEHCDFTTQTSIAG